MQRLHRIDSWIVYVHGRKTSGLCLETGRAELVLQMQAQTLSKWHCNAVTKNLTVL
jgi:hypothetical protein